jgi:hypothetical protein
MLAHALRDLFVRETELLYEAGEATGFFYGVQISALQVLDKAEDELFVVAGVAPHDGGHGREARQARGSPPALSGDELVAVCEPPHEQWLKDPMQADGFGELAQWFSFESRAHLLARWSDLVNRDHLRHQSLAST